MEECEHEIEVNDQITVQIKIPKKLTVLEFLGLTKQAEILMRAAQKNVMPESAPKKRVFADWTNERLAILRQKFNKWDNEKIAALPEFEGFKTQQIVSKAYAMGLKKGK